MFKKWELWAMVLGSGLALFVAGWGGRWAYEVIGRTSSDSIDWFIRVGVVIMVVGGIGIALCIVHDYRQSSKRHEGDAGTSSEPKIDLQRVGGRVELVRVNGLRAHVYAEVEFRVLNSSENPLPMLRSRIYWLTKKGKPILPGIKETAFQMAEWSLTEMPVNLPPIDPWRWSSLIRLTFDKELRFSRESDAVLPGESVLRLEVVLGALPVCIDICDIPKGKELVISA
jgi:hypothetical protein